MSLNEEKGKYIANSLGLNNGVIVNSGTIALLSALKILGINKNDKVLINGYCCYSLFEAIKNVGAEPIIVVPKNFYYLTDEEMEDVIINYDISCIINAHQYGIFQDIKFIKEKYPNIKIIEDIAQAWNIKSEYYNIGDYSDVVVTSFGKSKPLSYGQAGAVLSNNEIGKYFDFHDRDSRCSENIMLPFALYELDDLNERELVNNANQIIDKQREVANYLAEYFAYNNNVEIYYDGNDSCYHKFPIIIKNPEYITELEKMLQDNNILYQWQNDLEVWELNMVKSCDTKVIQEVDKPKYMLVRTRQNNVDDVKRLLRR